MENHKSIRDEQELLLLPAYDKTRPVVPVAAIFGANASGKSNLLDALRWLQDAVLHSFAAWQPGTGVPRTPFRLDPQVEQRPSGYAVDLLLDGARYSYGVVVDDERVREEWLHTYPHNRRRIIFEREGDALRLGPTVSDYRSRGDALARHTRNNALFLTIAALNDLSEVQAVYHWFRQALVFATAVDNNAVASVIRRLEAGGREPVVSLIRAADLGISDITVDFSDPHFAVWMDADIPDTGAEPSLTSGTRYISDDRISQEALGEIRSLLRRLSAAGSAALARSQAPRLVFHHGRGGRPLGLDDQSDGTRGWLALATRALDVLDNGGLLVVDEVDASLHPHLSERLINLFRHGDTNPKNAQILLTTHDATLLDEETLARDEIWFVDKDPDSGGTRLYPLTDFRPRKNENTEGRYLAGAYGAVPVLSEQDLREAFRRRGDADEAA